MAVFRASKVVSSLPGVLAANTLYFVRVGTGFRPYLTNSSGTVVAYALDPITWSELGGIPANVSSLGGLTLAANKLVYATGAGTLALADLTSAGRDLLDDSDAAAQRDTLSVNIGLKLTAAKTGNYTAVNGELVNLNLTGNIVVTAPAGVSNGRFGIVVTGVASPRQYYGYVAGFPSRFVFRVGDIVTFRSDGTSWFVESAYLRSLDRMIPADRPNSNPVNLSHDIFPGEDPFTDIGYSWVNQAGSTWGVGEAYSAVSHVANATASTINLSGVFKSFSVTGGDWIFDSRMSIEIAPANRFIGIGIRDSSNGKITGIILQMGTVPTIACATVNFTNTSTAAGAIGTTRTLSYRANWYLRIFRSGTTIFFAISSDGLTWEYLASQSTTGFTATPNQVGVIFDSYSTQAAFHTFYWLRRML